MNKEHRPIIIKDRKILSDIEKKRIGHIAYELCKVWKESHKTLDALTKDYREIVGYEKTDVGFEDQIEEFYTIDDPNDWIQFAIDERRRWMLEELSGDKK